MNSLLPHNATPQEIALDLTTARVGGVDVPTKAIWNPETCPEDVLPWLAWAFSVDQWDAAWSIEQKRAIVAASINVHKRKGTPGAVKAAVGAIFTGANVVEPWDDASLTAHQFKIVTTDTLRSDADFAELIRLVDAAKPVRSWLVAVQFERQSTRRLYFGTGHHVGAKTRIDLSLPLGTDEGAVYHGTGMLVATKTTIQPEA